MIHGLMYYNLLKQASSFLLFFQFCDMQQVLPRLSAVFCTHYLFCMDKGRLYKHQGYLCAYIKHLCLFCDAGGPYCCWGVEVWFHSSPVTLRGCVRLLLPKLLRGISSWAVHLLGSPGAADSVAVSEVKWAAFDRVTQFDWNFLENHDRVSASRMRKLELYSEV